MNSIPTNPARQSDKDSESMQGGTLEIRASALNNSSRLNGAVRQRHIVAFRPGAVVEAMLLGYVLGVARIRLG